MGKQLNCNLARMYCVALVTGKLCNQHGAVVHVDVSRIISLIVAISS